MVHSTRARDCRTDPIQLPGLITLNQQGTDPVLCLAGEIDLMVVETFEAANGRIPTPVSYIDAGHVTFIGSAGVQLLLRWVRHSAQAGRPAVLRRSSPALDLVLRVTGLAQHVNRRANVVGDG